MYKKDIINFLFVAGFPTYGLGLYLTYAVSPSFGNFVCSLPYILIVLFHLIDLLNKNEFNFRVNKNYWLILLFIISSTISLFVAYSKNLPDWPIHLVLLKSVLLLAPFHAFIIVSIYNEDRNKVTRLAFIGLSLLLFINVLGYYGLGLSNELHNIQGRINFPFLDGLYGVACLLAVLNLMLFYYLRKTLNKPVTTFFLITYFTINLFFFFYINSRLCILVFLLVIALLLLNVLKKFTGVFITSIFTIPLILNGGLLIFEILSLPFFKSILQRVDFVDVITFNGRSFLWETVVNWLKYDQEGLIFGNGYRGHYFLDLLGGLGKIFDLKALYHVHLHSATLEILVSQGIVGVILFFTILYKTFQYYKTQYQAGSLEGALFPVLLFIIFIIHIDTNGYLDSSGGLIIFFLISGISLKTIPRVDNLS